MSACGVRVWWVGVGGGSQRGAPRARRAAARPPVACGCCARAAAGCPRSSPHRARADVRAGARERHPSPARAPWGSAWPLRPPPLQRAPPPRPAGWRDHWRRSLLRAPPPRPARWQDHWRRSFWVVPAAAAAAASWASLRLEGRRASGRRRASSGPSLGTSRTSRSGCGSARRTRPGPAAAPAHEREARA